MVCLVYFNLIFVFIKILFELITNYLIIYYVNCIYLLLDEII